MIHYEQRDSSTARVPTVAQGQAIIVTRYEEEKAVIMNPTDFHRLIELDEALEAVEDQQMMSDIVLKAHQVEDEPGESIEDPVTIKAILGL